ncbi:exportin-7 [Naegleria gruberi]|uniref:Exportin-7 n=1 Tax=Naegleria gruberi TaxID=5762 RepID=D2UXV8_NAEGR|nr:exportin-7 [Naegleria gruberi]EFC50356.1 exportin-7 [Naegleria gruberi]|eukprot:XP_002683100.1 exportin-7 [Naegleria gruberi]
MMSQEDLARFETLCQSIYGQKEEARKDAERQLFMFQKLESYPKLVLIFDKSKDPHALFFASQQITKLLTSHWNSFSNDKKTDLRNYLLNYLASCGFELPKFVSSDLFKLVGRLTKLGWLEDQQNRDLPELIKKYFITVANPQLSVVGIRILGNIIEEMNTLTTRKSLTQHRKIAVSFRDLALRGIFETAIFTLKDVLRALGALCQEALELSLSCLKFDFVGIFPDESSEDIGTIQIPAAWRPLFEESDTLELFWNLYTTLTNAKLRKDVLQILVLLCSVRRSLFTGDDERKQFLSKFFEGMCTILQSRYGLDDQDTYHEFCRLLARIKSNFQLNEFVACKGYVQWLDLCANFSIESFTSLEWSNQSVYYILNLWSRLVASKPYLKSENESYLEKYVPEICKKYTISRLEYARLCAHDECDDNPLDHKENLDEQLDAIPQLVHFDYKTAGQHLTDLFDPVLQLYLESVNNKVHMKNLNELEQKLTWLTYIVGSVIGKRYVSSLSVDEAELLDGTLSARILRLIPLIDIRIKNYSFSNHLKDESLQHLEYALLYFMKNFKKSYLGDSSTSVGNGNNPKIFVRLAELLNIGEQLQVLNIFIGKIASNLKVWAKVDNIVTETMGLFDEIASGYNSAKLASKLETTQYLLLNHGPENFPFLNEITNLRQRTAFYKTLCKLLFLQNYTEDDFTSFIKPLESVSDRLNSIDNPEIFKQEGVKNALIGWCRDLRGIVFGCNNKRTYTFFFEWFFDKYSGILEKAAQVWYADQFVMNSLLKFLADFVLNKNQRIAFSYSSPHGILIFKKTSSILTNYGQRLHNVPIKKEAYAEKYKGICTSMNILSRCLAGKYCNFGVFDLYKDPALNEVLNTVIRLALSIPYSDIMAYPKLCRAYYGLMETLFQEHTHTIIRFETSIFLQILSSLEEGVSIEELSLSSQVCAALDNLFTFYYTQAKKNTPDAQVLANHLKQNDNLIPNMLTQFFRIIILEECGNQWSLSRTMLVLIVLNPSFYENLKQVIINSVAGDDVERASKVREAFDKLMDGVEINLEPKNRDKFTGNLITFRQDVRNVI